jgi:MFS family permease
MAQGHQSEQPRSAARTARLGLWALIGQVMFPVAVTLLHALPQTFDPLRQTLSEYAWGPYGWMMTLAFISLSAGSLLLAWGLYLEGIGRSRGALLFLSLWSAGLLLAGLFPTDLPGCAAQPSSVPEESGGMRPYTNPNFRGWLEPASALPPG